METVVTTFSGLMGSCAADFFSGTPTHAAEPSSARIAKLRQEINSQTALMPTTVPEKLADLQHPDAEHLLLGINLEGLREACELVGFPFDYGGDAWYGKYPGTVKGYKYDRSDHRTGVGSRVPPAVPKVQSAIAPPSFGDDTNAT